MSAYFPMGEAEKYPRDSGSPNRMHHSVSAVLGENSKKGSSAKGTRAKREQSYQLPQQTDGKLGSGLVESSGLGFSPTVQQW